ncbi:MAG: bifunctional diaminohydroxyphosphoribosylaminopyrimidine deaminase/5-amino-6-(5-phosphoribosylamino)uracil reductase RibD [Pseudomonadota bacterium]
MPLSKPAADEVTPSEADRRFMAAALALGERGLGRTWPNPSVGCILVKDGQVVGRGWTRPPPGNHGEVEALRRAGERALGATAYVTLEPCCHYGRTPPCTMALIHAGVRRVVVAATDPFPRVDGRGIEQLRQSGIQVDVGLFRERAEEQNAGFFLNVTAKRPLVTLKLATSLDGRIATASGESQWITGERARTCGHQLRASHDAIMVGANTARVDDPSLTCRLPGMNDRSPVRVVVSRGGRLSLESRLAQTASTYPTWMIVASGMPPEALLAHEQAGIDILRIGHDPEDERLDLRLALRALAERGITRLLVEGGAALAASLLRMKLVDRLVTFQSPMALGAESLPAIGELAVNRLADAPTFERRTMEVLASDLAATYITREP